MGIYDAIDLDFTWDGDFVIGKDGDLGDTSDDQIRSLENEIHNICKSEIGDWEQHPMLGANLSDFQGEPNTRESGKRLQERIHFRLVDAQLVDPADLEVRVIPVHIHQVLVIIKINAVATSENRLISQEPFITQLLYDTTENGIFFMPQNLTAQNAR